MPLFVQKAIEIKPDVAMVACLMGAVTLMFFYLRSSKTIILIFSAILSGIAILFLQKAASLIIFIHLILLYKVITKRIPLKAFFIFITVFFVTLLPFFLYLFSTNMLRAYWKFPVKFTMLWLGNHSHKLTFISYFFQWLNSVLIFLYILGILSFLKTEDQKLLGLFSIATLLSIFVNALIGPQYYMPVLPFVALISATVLQNGFKKQNITLVALCLLLIPLIYRNYKIGSKTPGCQPTLKRIQYVLNYTDSSDYVYDGHASFNIYRKDVDFFWFALDYRYGALFVYKNWTLYNYNIYNLIHTKKPKIISAHLLNVKDKRISRYYFQSPKYKKLYILNKDAIETLSLFRKWRYNIDKTILKKLARESSFLDSKQLLRIGSYFFAKNDWNNAIVWLENAHLQNSIHKGCLQMLITCYNNLKTYDKMVKFSAKLKDLQRLTYCSSLFEDGSSLDAVRFLLKGEKIKLVQVELFIHPPGTFRGRTAFLSFYKDGSFYLGKDFDLTNFEALGELYAYNGKILIPQNIPSGTYDVFFTFRIPRIDYRYHLLKGRKLIKETKIFIGKLHF